MKERKKREAKSKWGGKVDKAKRAKREKLTVDCNHTTGRYSVCCMESNGASGCVSAEFLTSHDV